MHFHPKKVIIEFFSFAIIFTSFYFCKDFERWKSATEIDNNISWSIARTKKTANTYVQYYMCNRSGKASLKPIEERIRNRKLTVTVKTGSHCSSFLTVSVTETVYTVKFCLTHSNHDIEIQHLRLSKEAKRQIAEQIQDSSVRTVLKKLRPWEEISERSHLINRIEIDNIINQLNVNKEWKKDANDFKSIEIFVQNDCN